MQKFLLTSFSVVLLSACGGGSDTVVEQTPLPPPLEQPVINYNGPAPATADVQNFKLSVWDNLATADRCGACHVQGQQSPAFARNDDINLAYADINPYIDFSQPSDSELISKVAGGHNCWLSSTSACTDIMTTWIGNWANQEQEATTIQLQAPALREPGANKNFPADATEFANTVHPIVNQYCADCHTSSAAIPIAPYFASDDVDEAYQASKGRINLDTPSDSRLVARIRDEFHNCWSDCQADALQLTNAIQAFSDTIEATQLDGDLINSAATTLFEGTLASGGGRFETNLIGKWEFKTGFGNIAFDTSGIEPALDLTLSGQFDWVGGWGVQLRNGKAQGSTSASRKMHDLITATGEFSIEAWVAPANVTQEGPARIVSYSGGRDRRNFTLGQTLYNYDALLRTNNTDGNGMPALSTADADEDLQAALQHVVFNYDAVNGRQIYVNGVFTDDFDDVAPGNLNEWDPSFAFVLGNEASGDVPWAGTIRMVAVHNRILSPEQIMQNFDVGVGQKFFLLFAISDIINVPEAYVVFEVSQFDSYSYLFSEPFFVSLAEGVNVDGIAIEGMRIGINGREAQGGQVFAPLVTEIVGAQYVPDLGQQLSSQGTIIGLEKGPEQDEFFLTFDRLGDEQYVRVPAEPPTPAAPIDLEPQPEIGIRNFAEINASMAALTTVAANQSGVKATFDQLRQQLPSVTDMSSFLASNQMAITQLAIKYCDALVEDNSLRSAYFPDFDFALAPQSAFDSAGRNALFSPLTTRMLGNNIGSQPSTTNVTTELNNLVDRLTQCTQTNSCSASTTRNVAKASCAAVLGSAVVAIQ
ncbi:LamG domain-containing protein [Alteromonas sp. ASW11-36]|uniref:LamG domain-containing protein n=1 Tax=Alteromonas arenosi TaxID=3055817 RepID=A0ABT7T0P8_9ALTE|nr:LamG domain-containing protein [Alteromonas sp. ASW11-36]MDM7862017.1 LamG domain-containing protein [Alteromonas sp. ASW11-36]